ncbi:hypothetical protein DPMN_095953 [Dreissena polymorpha]|uniref:Uncharacterized protein n=1 Tax=Dreissena polymorpha TaxID=45954 RepID=A0A9D4L7G3_DREPO|nr:hypothetical protein DPMN_095953 [Dreissena polymorpha]
MWVQGSKQLNAIVAKNGNTDGIRTNGTRSIGTQCCFAYADSRHPVNLSTRTVGTL